MAEFGFELEEIGRLIRLVETRGLDKLVLEEEGRRVVIRGGGAPGTIVAAPSGAGERHAAAQGPRQAIGSPMVGVFYRAASPDSAPFVEVGDHVDLGQAIGMIEAMKVFSEIPCDHAGTVVEIAAQSGQLVRQGEPLMFVTPDQS